MVRARRFLGSRACRCAAALPRARATALGRPRQEPGFALVEVLIAFTVLFLALTGVGFELATQYSSVGSSKTEQSGEGVLARALNQVRAVSFTVVAKGLAKSDVAGNATAGCTAQASTSYVKTSGTTWKLSDPTLSGGKGTGETLVHYSPITSTPPAPFYPHRTCPSVNHVRFTVRTFPTKYSTASTGSSAQWVTRVIRVTVIVSWQPTGRGGPIHLVGQTLVFPKTAACTTLGALTHENIAACQPNFTAVSHSGNGSIAVKPASSGPAISGLTFTDFELLLPGTTSSELLTTTASVDGTTQASGAEVVPTTSLDQVSRVESKATNNLASGTGIYQTVAITAGASAVSETSSTRSYSITATPSSGDSGTSVSTTSATATRACANFTTTKQTTKLPCGSGKAAQKTTVTLAAQLGAAGSTTLASVAATSTYKDRVFTSRYAKGQPTLANCPSTIKYGCITSQAKGGLGTVGLGGLPAAITALPSGWSTYLLKLSGFHAKVKAWARSSTSYLTGTLPKLPTTVAGTLSYYTATNHKYVTLTIGTSAQAPAIPTVTATTGTLTVSMTAHVVLGGATCTSATTSSHPGKPHARQCSISPLTGAITYVVTNKTTVIAKFTETISLGAVSATATYEQAT